MSIIYNGISLSLAGFSKIMHGDTLLWTNVPSGPPVVLSIENIQEYDAS